MENKKNRNKRLAIIAAMLALIVLILCLGGNTFAKYISARTIEADSVTVAKWGFVVKADVSDLFSNRYNKTEVVGSEEADSAAADVKATNVTVAPGTKGSMNITVAGQAEVLSKLTIKEVGTSKDVALVYKKGTATDNTTYNPIKWKLTDNKAATDKVVVGADGNGKLADVITYLEGKSEASIAIGTKLDLDYTLEWEWKLTDATDAAPSPTENDDLDTLLGLYAAKDDTDLPTGGKITAGTPYDSPAGLLNADKTLVQYTVDATTSTAISFELKISVEQIQNA